MFFENTFNPRSIEPPGEWESLIPIFGAVKSSRYHFDRGNWGYGALYVGLAISDVFLAKSLWQIGSRLVVRGGMSLLRREAAGLGIEGSVKGLEKAGGLASRTANELVEGAVKRKAWQIPGERSMLGMKFNLGPATQVVKHNGWWAKRVNPNANFFKRAWGAMSIEAQERALARLGSDMAPDFFVKEGMLFTRDVGKELGKKFGPNARLYMKASWRTKTMLNDAWKAGNSANGKIFDPAWDPVIESIVRGPIFHTSVDFWSDKRPH